MGKPRGRARSRRHGLSRCDQSCSGFELLDLICAIIAFTSEQMSSLSDILEAALPPSASSPFTSHNVPEHKTHVHTSVPPLQSSRKYNATKENNKPYGDLAKEFGVDAQVVEALAQRLSQFA